MLPVAVEIAPPDAPRDQVRVLLAACSRAVADADCVLASEAGATVGNHAVAIVTWYADTQVRVEVGLRVEGTPVWRSRSITFAANDETAERWRAVGFVVGTLARGAQTGQPESAEEPAPTSENKRPVPVAPKKAEPEPESRPDDYTASLPPRAAMKGALDVGVLAGPTWSGLRIGAVARARLPLYRVLRTLVSASYAERAIGEADLSGQWLSVGGGVGAALGNAEAELAASLDVRLEYLRARAANAMREEAVSRWRPGAGLTLAAAWTPGAAFGLYVGGDLAFMLSRTDIIVGDRLVQSDPTLRVAGEAGVRIRLW